MKIVSFIKWAMFIKSLIAQGLTILVGCIYPSYGCFKAIKSNDKEEQVRWLTYWIVYGVYSLVEFLAWPIFRYVPFYFEIKLALLIVLLHPRTDGAARIYRKFLKPSLDAAEKQIDDGLVQADSKVGPHMGKVADKVKEQLDKTIPDDLKKAQ